MAIASIPTNLNIQQANQQILLTWDNIAGALSYSIRRSLDGINFSNYATPATNKYLDITVTVGTQYWYQVASVNASGTSPYTSTVTQIPTPTAEMSLYGIRLASQQKADRINSDFVTMPEWNTFINLAMYELYDLIVTTYEDYFMAPRIRFTSDGSTAIYALPNGSNTFVDSNNSIFTPKPFYKLLGVDLALSTASNAFVTVNKFNLIKRNSFVYPNSSSTIYGVFNLQYRVLGTNIEFIPTPAAGQIIQLLYIPRLQELLQDTDITTVGFSGWLNYVIVRAAKYALDKEESDTTKLDAELAFIKARIEETADNRDAGLPDTISDVRSNGYWGGGGFGGNSPVGGY